MGSKLFQDEILPPDGRKYEITSNGDGTSKIKDVTHYDQYGSSFGAKEVLEQCFIECDYEHDELQPLIHKITTPNQNPHNIKVFFTKTFIPPFDKITLNGVNVTVRTASGKPALPGLIPANTYAFFFVKGNTLYYIGENQNIIFDEKDLPHFLTVDNSILNFDGKPVSANFVCPVINMAGYYQVVGLKGVGTVTVSVIFDIMQKMILNQGFSPSIVVRPVIDVDGDGKIDSADYRKALKWCLDEEGVVASDIFGHLKDASGVAILHLKKFETGAFVFEGIKGTDTVVLSVSSEALDISGYN